MTLEGTLVDVWRQVLVDDRSEVEVGGARYRVGRTRSAGLRVVSFRFEAWLLEGIEQNPQTSSRWAKLAQAGKRVMQFSATHRYFANVCEGAVLRYPAWKALSLPD